MKSGRASSRALPVGTPAAAAGAAAAVVAVETLHLRGGTGAFDGALARLNNSTDQADPAGPLAPSHTFSVRETLHRWNASLPSPLSQHTLVYLASGALARATSATLTSPLDSIKVRVQFSRRGVAAGVGVVPYSGAFEAARAMWVQEGVPAFFRGLPARLVYIVPAASVSFVFYEQFRAMYHLAPEQRAGRSHWWMMTVPLLLGGLARVAGTTIRTPFDIVRQRMQIQGSLPSRAEQLKQPVHLRSHGVYRSSIEALQGVTKVEGVRALWAGLGATVLRDVPFGVVYFLTYEHSKALQVRWLASRAPPPPSPPLTLPSTASAVVVGGSLPALDASTTAVASSSFASSPTLSRSPPADTERRAAGLSTPRFMLSGAFAAACAVAATMPMDVVKVRLQTQGSLPPPLRYKGVVDCAQAVWRTEGLRGFFRGFLPRVAYLAPSAALTFALYELYKSRLERVILGGDEEEHQ